MNVVAWVLDALKVPSEPMLPEALTDANILELADARSRLQQLSKTANDLRKLVDEQLAAALGEKAFKYGNDIYRASNGRGTAKVADGESFFGALWKALESGNSGSETALMAALFPLRSVKVTGLPMLAEALGVPAESLRDTLVDYEPSSSPLTVMPIQKAPKYLQDLTEGELR